MLISKDLITSKAMTKRQKHKLEKIRRKYKDQDDEEREIRLALLGSAGNLFSFIPRLR